MISPLLTPFRWYEKYHQQNRFESECADNCTFELITDTRHLLPFQFKREPSPYLITDWILRRCCDDPERKMLDKVDTNFVSESMSWVDVNDVGEGHPAWNTNCNGGICAITGGAEYPETKFVWTGLTIGKTYTYSIIIGKFNSLGNILTFSNGATVLYTFSEPGVVSGSFVATATDVFFAYSLITDEAEEFCVNYIQLTEAFELIENDVILEEAFIKYFSDGENDYFVYCGEDLGVTIPPGCYYSIMQDEGGGLYYSEVITVKDFFAETSPYLLLEWWNTCDIKDTIYTPVDDPLNPDDIPCTYKNRLYLSEAVVTKPDYPFKEEGEEDGNQSFNATFQKLDKNVLLIVPRVPEYIIDSLNGVRLHDTIQFTNPLRLKQEFVDDPIDLISVEATTDYIVNDCFANVTLKCLLDEKYVDETCCLSVERPECIACNVEIPDINIFNPDVYQYALVLTEGSDEVGLYKYDGVGNWVLQDSDSDILICAGDGRVWNYQPTNPLAISGYASVNGAGSLVYFSYVSGTTWNVRGSINTRSYGTVEISTNDGFTWLSTLTKFTYTDIFVNFPVQLVANPCCGDFLVRIRSFDLNGCDYGVSNAYTTSSPTNGCC